MRRVWIIGLLLLGGCVGELTPEQRSALGSLAAQQSAGFTARPGLLEMEQQRFFDQMMAGPRFP